MNKIKQVYTDYFRGSRSLEVINFLESDIIQQVYIYNYEGVHFRFFNSIIELIQFFEFGKEPVNSFLSEIELDQFLENLNINI